MRGAMEWIRKTYNVPARRGGLIRYDGKLGVIKSAKGGYLRVQLESSPRVITIHPTWRVEYLAQEGA